MTVIAVLYPAAGGAAFDHEYYMRTHIPLVRERWQTLGLTDVTVLRGTPGPDGAAPTYLVVALLTFGSMGQFEAAAAQHGKEIMGDIPNFTTAAPVLQFNDKVA